MFGRFTERAQKVLMLAQEEARRSNYPYVGTEHLLLGLIEEGGGIAAKVMHSLGIESEKVRQEVEKIIGKGGGAAIGDIGFTPRSKRVLELSFDEGRTLGHNYIGTEHILLGLIREGEGVAATVLQNLGADLKSVRQGVMGMLNGAKPSGGLPKSGESKSTPNLDEFGRDLTVLGKEGKLDPVVGREKEIERVIQVLSRRTKNNPVLIAGRKTTRCWWAIRASAKPPLPRAWPRELTRATCRKPYWTKGLLPLTWHQWLPGPNFVGNLRSG